VQNTSPLSASAKVYDNTAHPPSQSNRPTEIKFTVPRAGTYTMTCSTRSPFSGDDHDGHCTSLREHDAR